MAVVAANDRIGQLDVLDDGLQFAFVVLGDFAAKDGGNLIGLANRTIGIQEALPEVIQRGSAAEDQIVTIFHLAEEQPVLTACLAALAGFEEWGQKGEPFLSTLQ